MNLQVARAKAGISLRDAAKILGSSRSAAERLFKEGRWPVRLGAAHCQERLSKAFEDRGVDPDCVRWPALHGWRKKSKLSAEEQDAVSEVELMQMNPEVLRLFGLRSNPFEHDIEADEDVFRWAGYADVEQALRDTIENRGFLAVVSHSGSGKTTIWDNIEAEYAGRDDCVICKPQLKNKADLRPTHIAHALLADLLGDDTSLAYGAERQGRQLSRALRDLRTGTEDRKAVLLIDDAHFCNTAVLRQLKTFFEEKMARFRLLAIVLVGLPEMKTKLARFPEIGNRIRIVEVPPAPVREYLQFKFERVGASLGQVFDEGGLKAFLGRFQASKRRPALGRPLVINATCIRAMVRLHQNGAVAGEKITAEIVDSLPGGQLRAVA